jgi:tetratricopeptide (TPR) repeat protein
VGGFADSLPVPPEIQGLLATAEAQQAQGQTGPALAALQQARDKAQAGGNPALTAQVTFALATMQAAAGLGGEALASMRAASDLFGQAGDRLSHVRALIQVTGLQTATGNIDAAKTTLETCRSSAAQLGDGQLLSEVHLASGQLLLATRYAAAAVPEFRAGLTTATGLPDASTQVQLRNHLAVALFQCGNAAEALSVLAEAAKVAQAMPDGIAGAMALSTVGDTLAIIQRPLDAVSVGKQVLARLQQTGAQPLIIQAMIGLSNVHALAGQATEAAAQAGQAVAAAKQLGGPADVASVNLRLGMMAFQRGDRPTAAGQLRQARTQLASVSLAEPPMLTQMLAQLGS